MCARHKCRAYYRFAERPVNRAPMHMPRDPVHMSRDTVRMSRDTVRMPRDTVRMLIDLVRMPRDVENPAWLGLFRQGQFSVLNSAILLLRHALKNRCFLSCCGDSSAHRFIRRAF